MDNGGPFSSMKWLGRVAPRSSLDVQGSRLSVGFETLDRAMFDPEPIYPHLAALGVKWARLQTGWGRTERERGVYDFDWLDSVVDALLGIGIQPFFNVGYGNQLYVPEAPAADAVGWPPIFHEEAREAWLRYVDALVSHFGERVSHYEIWNEPDIRVFWKPHPPDPRVYTELVKITAPVIRKRRPGAIVIGGVIAHGHKADGMDFLEACLQEGMADAIDVLSFHPYEQVPEAENGKGFAAMRAVLASHGADLGLWQGEGGWPSRYGGWGAAFAESALTEEKQAKWLARLILRDLGAGLDLTSYFHMTDFVNYFLDGSRNQPQFFGLLRGEDHTPKPSYFAYQCLCAIFDSDTMQDSRVMLRRFGSAGEAGDALPELVTTCQSAGFTRGGTPVVAFWYPVDQSRVEWEPRAIDAEIWYPADLTLDRPVLVDVLTQDVHEVEVDRAEGKVRTLRNVPLMDYPLLLCDAGSLSLTQ